MKEPFWDLHSENLVDFLELELMIVCPVPKARALVLLTIEVV